MGISSSSQKEKCRDWASPPSWAAFRVAAQLRRFCLWMADWLAPPPLLLAEKAVAFSQSQVIYCLSKLGVTDALATGPKTAEELASQLGAPCLSHTLMPSKCIGVHPERLYRVLRAAVNFHCLAVVRGVGGGQPRFRNTAVSSLLREDHPNSLKAIVGHIAEDSWSAWGELAWAVRTGDSAFKKSHDGRTIWEHLKADQEQEQQFSRAMICQDAVFGAEAVVLDYNWWRYQRVVDIGGAYGSFLARVLRHNTRAAGVLFDQPQVVDNAREVWDKDESKTAVRKRVSFVGGDFFKEETLPQPEAGDVWVMRTILHDWSDEESAQILSTLRAAIGATPVTLAIVEASILNEWADPFPVRQFLDLHMMVEVLGRERTPAQWKALFRDAGFRLSRIVACRGPMAVVEAVPV